MSLKRKRVGKSGYNFNGSTYIDLLTLCYYDLHLYTITPSSCTVYSFKKLWIEVNGINELLLIYSIFLIPIVLLPIDEI